MKRRLASILLGLLVVSSLFQAASLVNIGAKDTGYAVSPYLAMQLAVTGCLLVSVLMSKARLRIDPSVFGRPVFWLVIFTMLAVASSLALPYVFEGMGVYSPRGGIDDQYRRLTPLHATASQIAQAGYLMLNAACILFFMQARFKDAVGVVHRTVIVATLIVVLFAFWQAVSLMTGIYFPDSILYSAAGRSQGFEQTMEGVRRINSTFPEASFLGTFLVSMLAYVSRYLLGAGGWRYWLLAGVIGVAALVSTSTSAYVGLGILGAAFIFWIVRSAVIYRRVSKYALVFLSTVLVAMGGVVYLVNTNRVVSLIYDAALKNKVQSESFLHRIAADSNALKILFDTGGLGVGLGSNRPSSFLAYLLSNVGLVGTLLFGLFLHSLFKARRRRNLGENTEGHGALVRAASAWGLAFCLIGMCVAVPDISFPSFWVWVVLLVIATHQQELPRIPA
jgi:hypothetical protein